MSKVQCLRLQESRIGLAIPDPSDFGHWTLDSSYSALSTQYFSRLSHSQRLNDAERRSRGGLHLIERDRRRCAVAHHRTNSAHQLRLTFILRLQIPASFLTVFVKRRAPKIVQHQCFALPKDLDALFRCCLIAFGHISDAAI